VTPRPFLLRPGGAHVFAGGAGDDGLVHEARVNGDEAGGVASGVAQLGLQIFGFGGHQICSV